jgi:hypothetical protein
LDHRPGAGQLNGIAGLKRAFFESPITFEISGVSIHCSLEKRGGPLGVSRRELESCQIVQL